MREIKFRAWDKTQERMWLNVQNAYDTLEQHCCEDEDCECTDEKGNFICLMCSSFQEVLRDENLTVMQYTGLKDKNGKEIYEGDILIDENAHSMEVVWNSARCRFDPVPFCWHVFEIIGNIYENPELLYGNPKRQRP